MSRVEALPPLVDLSVDLGRGASLKNSSLFSGDTFGLRGIFDLSVVPDMFDDFSIYLINRPTVVGNLSWLNLASIFRAHPVGG